MNTNKYEEIIQKFEPMPSDEKVSDAVKSLLQAEATKNNTTAVWALLHGCVDLTTLTALDTKESVWAMVERVNAFEGQSPDVPNVAAICTYPFFVPTVKQALTAQNVSIASVSAGFPASQTFTEIKVAETAMAVMEGADEIDIVMNLGYFMAEDSESLTA